MTLHDLIDGLATSGERPALIAFTESGRREWTYRRLGAAVAARARWLRATGLESGQTVALWAPDRPEWIVAALAAIRAGGLAAPLDAQFTDEALAHVLLDSEARVVFTTTDRLARVGRLRPAARLVALDALAADLASGPREGAGAADALPAADPEAPAALFYTSGTTGPPKGVPLTHGNLTFQVQSLVAAGLVGPADRVCLPLPLHHVYPFVIGVLVPLALGLPVILPHALTGPQILRALREGEATVLVAVPRLCTALLSAIEGQVAARGRVSAALFRAALALSIAIRRRLGLRAGRWLFRSVHARLAPTLRLVTSGGAALDPGAAWRLQGLGWELASGYGLTETSPLLTLNPPGSPRPESAGRPIPGVALRIAPVAGGPAEGRRPGEGEVQVRGPGVFRGYLHLAAKTRAAFTSDGWFRTGDLGVVEAGGWLHLTGRIDEMLVTAGGENVDPERVEAAFLRHPFLREFAVLEREGRLVGLALPELGQIRAAGRTDVDAAVREAIAAVNAGLPSYQRVGDVAVTRDPLPRTRLGKLRRPWLPDLWARARAAERGETRPAGPVAVGDLAEADRALLEHAGARAVWEWLAARYPDRRLTMDVSPALDLGVDSLEWLALTVEIERRAGIELDEAAIARIGTVRDLLREVVAAPPRGEALPGVPWDEPERVLSPRQARWLRPLGPGLRLVSRALCALNRGLLRGPFALRVVGLEGLPDAPCVLVANHASVLDPLAVSAALGWRRLARTYWGGWTGLAFRNPLMRAISRLWRVLPIEPETGVASSLALGAAVLRRGDWLVWFPEGERSVTGKLLPFRPGIGLLLHRFPRPVVPVRIEGTFEAWPRGRRWPRRRPLAVIFGAPIDPRRLAGPEIPPDAAARRIVRALEAAVAALGAGPVAGGVGARSAIV